MKKVAITEEEYVYLQLRDAELRILEMNGVDNWGEYGGFSDDEYWQELYEELQLIKKDKGN